MDAYNYHRKAAESVPHDEAELCINAWYYTDHMRVVMRLAVKVYALRGSDEEKLTELRRLAATDHLTATMGQVPKNFTLVLPDGQLQGAVTHEHMKQDPMTVFEDLFTEIEKELPDLIVSVNDNYERRRMKLPEPFLWVCTPVFESQDGILNAQVS